MSGQGGKGRFVEGQSGNPKGRSRKSQTVDASLMKALKVPVTVIENGRRRRIPKLDVTTRQLVNQGAAGDHRATKLALSLAQQAEQRASVVTGPAVGMTESDQEIADRVIDRLTRLLAIGQPQ